MNPAADSPTVRERFLAVYKADLLAGRVRTLGEYQAQFKGHEESIADEWRWLEPETLEEGKGAERKPAQQQIGPYRVIEELGHGAQATVYLAEHVELHRRVALKVLRAPVTDGSSRSEQRFRREAEVTASIEHPNICSVYETGSTDGVTWIAMQYVPGRTLAAYLARQREEEGAEKGATLQLPASDSDTGIGITTPSSGSGKRSDLMRVVAFTEQAARALHVAHERGLVHRDIKPGNLMVADDGGRPVILDFGLAHTDESLGGMGLTRSDEVLGTPYYMAPEQLRADGDVVDRRTDVYALGVTLFECLTGRRPFDAVSVEALYQQILTVEPTAPRTLNPQIPRDLEVVVQTAIEKERGRRYQTALDFAEDLRRVRQHEPIRAKPVSTWGRVWRLARRHPGVAASLSLAVVSLVAGLVVSLLFLQEANQALGEKEVALGERNEALADFYETVSLRSASDNMRRADHVTLMQQRLRDRAIGEIRRENPGYASQLYNTVMSVRGGVPGNRMAELLAVIRKAADLSPTGQHAVADLLVSVVRIQLQLAQLLPTPEGQELAVVLAEEHLGLLKDLPLTDDRRIRARILLLDNLNQNNKPAAARDHITAWLAENEEASLRDDPSRVALYHSRLAASLVGMGDAKGACELFKTQDILRKVSEAFPHSWYSNVAKADLVVALDKAGQPSEEARRELGESSRNSLGHRTLGHQSIYVFRTLFGDTYKHLWDQLVELHHASLGGHIEIDGLLAELERPRKLGEASVDEVAACFYMHAMLEWANALGMGNADFSHPDVGRLSRLSAEYCRSLPSCHYSHRGRAYTAYGKYLAACGRYEEAMEWADLVVQALPVNARWNGERRLGSYLVRLGDFERARILLHRSLLEAEQWYDPSENPAMEIRNDLARLNRMTGNLEEARTWHEKNIDQWKRSAFQRRFLAVTNIQLGKLDEADHALREALDLAPENVHNRVEAGWMQAQVLLLRGDHDAAIRQAEEARALAQRSKQGSKRSGRPAPAAMRQKQRPLTGERRRNAALVRNAVRGADRVQAMALFARGKPGDTEAALRYFKTAAEGPDRVDGDGFWSDYGKALAASGDVDGAREVLEKLTTRRSGDPLAWHARARFLATAKSLTDDDRRKAVEYAEKATQHRTRAFVLATLAEAQFQAGDVESARQTAAEVRKLMAGRDAQWLSVKQAEARFTRYRGK